VIPPQIIIVAFEPPDIVADAWEKLTAAGPDIFNAWFVLTHWTGRDD
jgi:hypothetical protein